MENINIYSYIENYDLTTSNFLDFVTTLCNYFSWKFGVRNCPIKIHKLNPMDSAMGKIPPARYGYIVKKEVDKKTATVTYERLDEAIEFNVDLSRGTNIARIVKLTAHEWMHFYDAIFKWKEVGKDKIDEEYKDLILKSHQYSKIEKDIKSKHEDVKIFAYINKLSAKETVADKHAQNFLKELYVNISNEKLKRQIAEQIKKHDEQIKDYVKYLESKGVSEESIIK